MVGLKYTADCAFSRVSRFGLHICHRSFENLFSPHGQYQRFSQALSFHESNNLAGHMYTLRLPKTPESHARETK